MKQQIQQLIDRLADKTLSFGCFVKDTKTGEIYRIAPETVDVVSKAGAKRVEIGGDPCCCGDIYWDEDGRFKILGHPILIGDLIDLVSIAWTYEQQEEQWLDLVKLWHECGAKKSLQEIFDRTEWENVEVLRAKYGPGHEEVFTEPVPKDPAVRSLFEFLLQLNI